MFIIFSRYSVSEQIIIVPVYDHPEMYVPVITCLISEKRQLQRQCSYNVRNNIGC